MVRMFGPSAVFTVALLALAALVGGPSVFVAVAVLAVLEVSLSFDNAVVNAKVLERMNPFWQKMFLTVGILVAVVGMRLVLPVLLVAVTASLNPMDVWQMALHNPEQYQHNVEGSSEAIYAFGGTFLLMIFLDMFFDADGEKDIDWLRWFEAPMRRIGRLDNVSIMVALLAVFTASRLAADGKAVTVMVAGVFGLLAYLVVASLDSLMSTDVAGAGIAAFLYLEVLDASFSFDGVIGAFAISNEILVIALGLGIGALWVRSMTIFLVRKGTLAEFVYLEHGAHWAIGILAAIMLTEVKYEVSEYVTGVTGVLFIVAAVVSSIIVKKRHPELAEQAKEDPVSALA